jgi:hypothetical protein
MTMAKVEASVLRRKFASMKLGCSPVVGNGQARSVRGRSAGWMGSGRPMRRTTRGLPLEDDEAA